MNEMYIIGCSIITLVGMILSIIALVEGGPVGPRGKDGNGIVGATGTPGEQGARGPAGIMTVQCDKKQTSCKAMIPGELVVDTLTVDDTLQVGNNPDYKWDANGIQLGSPSNQWTPSGGMMSNLFVGSPSNQWTPSGIQLGSPSNQWTPSGELTTSDNIMIMASPSNASVAAWLSRLGPVCTQQPRADPTYRTEWMLIDR